MVIVGVTVTDGVGVIVDVGVFVGVGVGVGNGPVDIIKLSPSFVIILFPKLSTNKFCCGGVAEGVGVIVLVGVGVGVGQPTFIDHLPDK